LNNDSGVAVSLLYTEFRYQFPPRAGNKHAVPKVGLGGIDFYERNGYNVAQIKKNGTCNTAYIAPDKQLIWKTRHPDENDGNHGLWKPDAASERLFKRVPGDGWHVVVNELMHSKGNGIKNTNYIRDILVLNGKSLVGTTWEYRQQLLRDIFLPMARKKPDEYTSHIVLDDNTWLAKNHAGNLRKLFEDLEAAWAMGEKNEDEGIVLFNPKGKLAPCVRELANESWMYKCRRPHKNYKF
jgi:hypothetical protein